MVPIFRKTPTARQPDARVRAKRLGVRIALVVPQRHFVTHRQSEACTRLISPATMHGM